MNWTDRSMKRNLNIKKYSSYYGFMNMTNNDTSFWRLRNNLYKKGVFLSPISQISNIKLSIREELSNLINGIR